jgi:hypothetical protein
MKKSAVEKNGVVWVTEEDNLSLMSWIRILHLGMSVTHIDASEHEPSYYKLVSLHINDYRYFVYFPFDV